VRCSAPTQKLYVGLSGFIRIAIIAPSNLSERISPFGAALCKLDGAAQRRMKLDGYLAAAESPCASLITRLRLRTTTASVS
jgi:hypothetical protein